MGDEAFAPEVSDAQDVAAAKSLGRRGRVLWPLLMLAVFLTIALVAAKGGDDLDLLEGNGRSRAFVIQGLLYSYAATAFLATFMPALLGKIAASDRTTFGAAIGFAFGAVCGVLMNFATAFHWFGLEPRAYTEVSFTGLGDLPMLVLYALLTSVFFGLPTVFLGIGGALLGGLGRRTFAGPDPLFSDDFEA